MIEAIQVFAQTVEIPDIDIVGIGAIVLALAAIIMGVRAVNKTLKKANRFFDDWYGDKETGKPGVIVRLGALEDNQSAMRAQVESINTTVQTQLGRNGGSTVADAAFEALRVVQEVQIQVEEEVKERKVWVDQYTEDQHSQRREWTKVFTAIRQMIPIEDKNKQLELWDDISERYTKGEL